METTNLFIIGGIFVNFIISLLIGYEGRKREIGFRAAFVISLLLSPIVGFGFMAISKRLENEEPKEKPEEKSM
jgi:MFS family permease